MKGTQSFPQHDNIIILASSPEAVNYRPIEGYITIAVNGAINISKNNTDYWFTLDPSRSNLEIMRSKSFSCSYYAAVGEDFGNKRRNKFKPPSGVRYFKRVCGSGPKGEHFRLRESADEIATGNSAYGALNLAYHMNPKRIILLGVSGTSRLKFDGKRCYDLSHLPDLFSSAVRQLENKEIEVINANLDTSITCFNRIPFEVLV